MAEAQHVGFLAQDSQQPWTGLGRPRRLQQFAGEDHVVLAVGAGHDLPDLLPVERFKDLHGLLGGGDLSARRSRGGRQEK